MSEISPAGKAVMDAVVKVYPAFPDEVAAAALRAAITAVGAEEMFHPTSKRTEGVKWCVQRIYAIADELEVKYPIN